MDLIDGSDEEEYTTPVQPVARRPDRRFLNAAPQPSLLAKSSLALTIHKDTSASGDAAAAGGSVVLMNNPAKAVLYQPAQGPQMMDPQRISTDKPGETEANVAFDETTFNEQRTAFQRSGRALAPNTTGELVTRTTLGYTEKRLEHFAEQAEKHRKRPRFEDKAKEKEALVLGDDDDTQFGIWGPPTKEERWHNENALSDIARDGADSLAPEQLAEREFIKERNIQKGLAEEENKELDIDRLVERKMAHLLPPKLSGDEAMEPTTKFHGKEEFDYKGNSWMAPPAGLGSVEEEVDVDHHKCYVPKKCVHRFTGHNKGVHRIRLFPKTGHLLLSAGLDGKCKVWSIEARQVMRTYVGHTAAVRDVQFNHDGTKFVSASFDRRLRLWNTETGAVLQTFTNRKVPYVVKFYPHDDNFFVVGCSDNKIVTYDATTAEITQEYNHHLGPVNAIVFVEDHGTKMITTSDDKKVLVWEWDIGVPIKYISDPTMHSMPCMTLHPAKQFLVGQSLDNQIVVFQAQNRFAIQKKRKFAGHQVSGYACEMAFSPDGQFLVSGDGNGKLCIWEWKRSKMLQKYKAHDKGPTIGCVWHPLEPSVLFTCGWDGVIKMWQ
jgi:pre-mRNA-processing factor 17